MSKYDKVLPRGPDKICTPSSHPRRVMEGGSWEMRLCLRVRDSSGLIL